MDYEKMYKAVLKTATQWIKDGCSDKEKICLESIFPELRESEDERIRKELINFLRSPFIKENLTDEMIAPWLAYLEKQKYDRMKPIYDARESFEYALEKAWNDYHNGYENVDRLEDDYVECAYAKGFREGYLFGVEKQKEQKHPNGCFTCDEYKKGYEEGRRNGFTAGYNKAMKEVEQKEQKPVVTLGETYHVDTLGTQQVIAGKMPQKPAEWSEEDEKMIGNCIDLLEHFPLPYGEVIGSWKDCIAWLKSLPERFNPQPKPEWSEKHIADVFEKIGLAKIVREQGNDKLTNALQDAMLELSKVGNTEWREEDEEMRKLLIAVLEVNHPNGFFKANEINTTDMRGIHTDEIISWLKSLPLNLKKRNEDIEKLCSNEWSEEDEEMLNSCISSIEESKENRYAYKENDGDTSYDREITFMKSLPQRFNLPPKQEQNDYITPHKEFFKFIYDRLINVHKENPNVDYMKSFKERLNNLSFGEKQEWSEADKAIINCIVCCLDGQFVSEAARKQSLEWFNKHRRDFLNQPKQEWNEEDREMIQSIITNGCVDDKQERWLRMLPERIYQQKHDWKPIAIAFMNYLDENRPEGKMSLSNGECADIDKAFKENDWNKIFRYIEKYGRRN